MVGPELYSRPQPVTTASRCSYSWEAAGRHTGLMVSPNDTDGIRIRATSKLLDLEQI